jgi:hypothetical protein
MWAGCIGRLMLHGTLQQVMRNVRARPGDGSLDGRQGLITTS